MLVEFYLSSYKRFRLALDGARRKRNQTASSSSISVSLHYANLNFLQLDK